MTEGAEVEARRYVSWLAGQADETFGNARAIRQFFESLQPVQAERLAEEAGSLEDLTDDDLLTLTEEGVRMVADA